MPKTEHPEQPEQQPEQTAQPPEQPRQINPFDLPVGDPFALSLDCELVDRGPGATLPAAAGTFATVQCKCGAVWRANLLSEDPKECPDCHACFTHILAIVPLEDRSALREIVQEILVANGLIEDDGDDDEEPEHR